MPYRIGVDLGTTSITAAVCDESGPRVVRLGERSAVTPSAVYRHDDGSLVVGHQAASQSVTDPGRVARDFVRRLGDPEPVLLGGQPYTVAELVCELLLDAVRKVTRAQGSPPAAAVLTHPLGWDERSRALLLEVALQAGLPGVTLLPAPEAIVARWAATAALPAAGPVHVAVYDLGGGMFDAAVLAVDSTGSHLIGAPEGRHRLGGVDFDAALLRHVDRRCDGALAALGPSNPAHTSALAQVWQDCARAKETLSGRTEVVLPVLLPEGRVEVRVPVGELEELLRGPVGVTVDALVRAIDSCELPSAGLAAVLLVGGSSRIPLVAAMVSGRLGRAVAARRELDFAAALGAAGLARHLAGVKAPARTASAHTTIIPVYPGPPRRPPAPPQPSPPRAPRPTRALGATRAPGLAHTPRSARAPRPAHTAEPRYRFWAVAAVLVAASLLVGLVLAARMGAGMEPPADRTLPTVATAPAPTLVLTEDAVRIRQRYYAEASGFQPGELIEMLWIGPTSRTLGAAAADDRGGRRQGPVIERDPPGHYQVIARGLRSGRTASAWLDVLPAR